MKRVIVRYSCGYGAYETDFKVEDDLTDKEIEQEALEVTLRYFDWSFEVEEKLK